MNNNINTQVYAQKVELLLRLMLLTSLTFRLLTEQKVLQT